MGQVRQADEVDAERAVAAAKAAFPAWSRTTKQERIAALKRMHAAVAARHDALLDAIVEEYGAPASRSAWMASYPAEVIAQAIEALLRPETEDDHPAFSPQPESDDDSRPYR